uniref:Uncharacterized protein n=1 Tax=Timema poppense TaxID=170557 RepID=A0A7R9H2H8_TIMPO|nr:unnamed protein product [Timema poppensis]
MIVLQFKNVLQKVEIISMKDKENCLARTANMKITEESAVITIQKHYRGYQTRKHYGPLLKASSGKMNTATASFMRPFCKKWKAKSIFQVLLMYRSARYQDLVYFSQQVKKESGFKLRTVVIAGPTRLARGIMGVKGKRKDLRYTRNELLLRPLALSSESLKLILWDGGREGERHGVASQPTKVSFRANKNRWITETVDGASYRTGLAEKSYVWKYQFYRERGKFLCQYFEHPLEYNLSMFITCYIFLFFVMKPPFSIEKCQSNRYLITIIDVKKEAGIQ